MKLKLVASVLVFASTATALDCNPNACSISSPLPLGITSGGYLAIGPNTESPLLAYSGGRNVAAIRPTGKLELAGDPNAVLNTADISVMGDAESEDLAWIALELVEDFPLHPGFASSWPGIREQLEGITR